MNAYELADELLRDNTQLTVKAAYMLRQQADKIAELEKKSKPVAWVYETENVDGEPYLTDVSLKPLFGLVTRYGYKEIPLYTTPQTKPLSDEEILEMTIWNKNLYELYVEMEKEDMIAFARSIEKAHGIK